MLRTRQVHAIGKPGAAEKCFQPPPVGALADQIAVETATPLSQLLASFHQHPCALAHQQIAYKKKDVARRNPQPSPRPLLIAWPKALEIHPLGDNVDPGLVHPKLFHMLRKVLAHGNHTVRFAKSLGNLVSPLDVSRIDQDIGAYNLDQDRQAEALAQLHSGPTVGVGPATKQRVGPKMSDRAGHDVVHALQVPFTPALLQPSGDVEVARMTRQDPVFVDVGRQPQGTATKIAYRLGPRHGGNDAYFMLPCQSRELLAVEGR
jgi:hypothetical protein